MTQERCATVAEAISSISSLEEMEGYIWGLKKFGADVTRQEWSQIAHAKISLMGSAGSAKK